MQAETFTLKSLASYLGRDARDLERLANQGQLPGRRVGREWRVHRAEVTRWLETEMPHFSPQQLQRFEESMDVASTAVEVADSTRTDTGDDRFIIRSLMSESTIALPLDGRTAGGVVRALVDLANASWQVYDPPKVLQAIREREAIGSTAFAGGFALPHPGRRMAAELGDSLVAFGRTNTGIPFGGPAGQQTDLFFLILCRDDRTHLQCLARLARITQQADFLTRLREVPTPAETLDLIEEAESAI